MLQLHANDFGRDPEQGMDRRTAREIDRYEDDRSQMHALRSFPVGESKGEGTLWSMILGAEIGSALTLAFVLWVTR